MFQLHQVGLQFPSSLTETPETPSPADWAKIPSFLQDGTPEAAKLPGCAPVPSFLEDGTPEAPTPPGWAPITFFTQAGNTTGYSTTRLGSNTLFHARNCSNLTRLGSTRLGSNSILPAGQGARPIGLSTYFCFVFHKECQIT